MATKAANHHFGRMIACPLLLFSIHAFAQAPMVGNYASAPDEWLLGRGQRWHYHTDTAKKPQELAIREPIGDEIAIVDKAKILLNNSSAKAVALIDGDQIVWSGYNLPANSKSLLLSFSVGKTITAMAIGKAVCAGKLSLTDSAESFVAELKDTALGRATVQQLLEMSSGTSAINRDSSIMSAEQERDMRLGKISFVDILKTPKVSNAHEGWSGNKRQPGEVFDYHGTDPLLLGVILNRATGISYAKWVEKEVLIPAGISNEAIIGQDHFDYGMADGNVRMTLEDWARFAIWVKRNESGSGCFSDYVKQASITHMPNTIKREGKAFDGYGYLIWTENYWQKNSYWAVGYGGQRIAWNHKNQRILIAFSNVENYMDKLYALYADWATLPSKD